MMIKKYKILHIPTSTFMMIDTHEITPGKHLYFNQEERNVYKGIFDSDYGDAKHILEIKEYSEFDALETIKKIVEDYYNDPRWNKLYGNELFYCPVEIFEKD